MKNTEIALLASALFLGGIALASPAEKKDKPVAQEPLAVEPGWIWCMGKGKYTPYCGMTMYDSLPDCTVVPNYDLRCNKLISKK